MQKEVQLIFQTVAGLPGLDTTDIDGASNSLTELRQNLETQIIDPLVASSTFLNRSTFEE